MAPDRSLSWFEKRKTILMFYRVFVFLLPLLVYGGIKPYDIRPDHYHDTTVGKIRILDQKELSYRKVDKRSFSEISDLAYDTKSQNLYMIGDEGSLFTFKAVFGEKITTLDPFRGEMIRKGNGKPFKPWKRDSEGLAFGSKGGLLISFEGDAKLGLFDYEGTRIRQYALPQKLSEKKNYRSANKSLEALALHPQYGALMVSEWPLKKDHKKLQTIYSLSGREWHFRAEPESRSAVTAIETMDDGSVLLIERSFISLLHPLTITLKKVDLRGCQNKLCHTETLVKMSTAEGWSIDNFEGLAKVGKHRYIMVSDDNDNFMQKTLLVYFEVIE
ncbi:MAG TPA: esterase-like activity of phytase family protein [Epsilonproteobacteria bacterium]|nr:esterase-like activity of phytase family protein [Campylobacterota bacterium]